MSETAITVEQFQALVRAVQALQIAVNNLASKAQLRQLYTLRQQEIEELKTRLDTIEQQVQILQRS